MRRLVNRLALSLALLNVLAVALWVLPSPTYALWVAHLAVVELSGILTLVGLLAWVLARGGRREAASARWAARLALPTALAGLVPFLAIAPTYYRTGTAFSWREYVHGLEPPAVRIDADVDLGAGGLRADIYRPPTRAAAPLLVIVHGGSWQHGDKGGATSVSTAFANAGYVVADVQYRLAPAFPFPAAVADVKCLVGRLRERAGELGLDPARVALLGRSAGGQIVLIAAYSMGDLSLPPSCDVPQQPVQAVISLYGPTDLVWGHDNPNVPDPIDGTASIEMYLGGAPRSRPEAYRRSAALSWVDHPIPATLLIHGEADRLVRAEHARRLAAGLAAKRQPAETLLIPMTDHGFDYRPGGLGEQLARAAILRTLARLR